MKRLKIIPLTLVLAVTFLTAAAQEKIAKDKIKSIIVYEEKSDLLIKKQYKESETWYDQQGNILEEIKYDEGKVIKHFKYQYDPDGNKIKEEEFDPSGRLKELSEYKFENGLRVEKIVYDQNKKIRSKKTYAYTRY